MDAEIKRKRKICKDKIITGELTADEEDHAERYMCRVVQEEVFGDERRDLESKGMVSLSSDILTLNPFLDKYSLIRASGRIKNATYLPIEMRQPIILPKKGHFTFLLVHHYHVQMHHINTSTVICEIRHRFWIPELRQLLNSVQHKCQQCRVWKAKPRQPQMGDLPLDRITPFVRPFSYVGLDYFRPVTVTIRRQKEKRWVALFTCLSIRAIHLEIASDLSTDACLICIRNFINRRGVPILIRSDNWTNFVRITKELKGEKSFIDENSLISGLAGLGRKRFSVFL